MRSDAAGGGMPTHLHKQLKELIPTATSSVNYEFACRSCKLNIESAVNLKYRYEEALKVILNKITATSIAVAGHSTNENTTPPRKAPLQPRKRSQHSPFAKTGITPLSKKHMKEIESCSPLVQQPVRRSQNTCTCIPATRRELFPSSNQHEEALALPIPALPSRIPRASAHCTLVQLVHVCLFPIFVIYMSSLHNIQAPHSLIPLPSCKKQNQPQPRNVLEKD